LAFMPDDARFGTSPFEIFDCLNVPALHATHHPKQPLIVIYSRDLGSYFTWLRLSATNPIQRSLQRPRHETHHPTNLLHFLAVFPFLASFPLVYPANEAGSLSDVILGGSVMVRIFWTLRGPTSKALLRTSRQLKIASR